MRDKRPTRQSLSDDDATAIAELLALGVIDNVKAKAIPRPKMQPMPTWLIKAVNDKPKQRLRGEIEDELHDD